MPSIEVENNDMGSLAQLMHLATAYLRARHDSERLKRVSITARAEEVAEELIDEVLVELDGIISRRVLAAVTGLSQATVNQRIACQRSGWPQDEPAATA